MCSSDLGLGGAGAGAAVGICGTIPGCPIIVTSSCGGFACGGSDDGPVGGSGGAGAAGAAAGGLLGGTWLASLTSDLGAGKFDGAWLVQNFENLNPANTFWDKYYQVFANIDTEPARFLEFENDEIGRASCRERVSLTV